MIVFFIALIIGELPKIGTCEGMITSIIWQVFAKLNEYGKTNRR